MNASTRESLEKLREYAEDGSIATETRARAWSPAPFLVVVEYRRVPVSPPNGWSINGNVWCVWYLWVFGHYRYLDADVWE